ncbi:MAG: ectonucleotide pyrophosphatase/phosphodiesterase [Bacteroidota bacterium]
MRLTAASLLALALACFWLVGGLDGCGNRSTEAEAIRDAPPPAVVLVSIDGFRADYLDRSDVQAPVLRRLAEEGVRADRMVPVFPSITLPNHWSLATGLHPEAHGIVGNEFREPDGRVFAGERKTGLTEPEWWGGEPIWQTAERQGLRAGTVFWPGSEAIPPSRWLKYDTSLPYDARVDTALAWLDHGTHFVTLYFEAVDSAGHGHGPDTPEVARAIGRVDAALAHLVAGLEARRRLSTTDLVIVGDHGMTALSRDRLVFLDDAADLGTEAEHILWSVPTHVWPRETADTDDLVTRLDALDHVSAYRREDTPEHLHFRKNDRIAPVVVIPDLGWSVTTRARAAADPAFPIAGSHGFDVREPDMHALFLARGPHFRSGQRIRSLRTVDVHGILARALGIEPAPTAGSDELAGRLVR